ncbi:c-type cytochrome [Hwangdonia lutea]|uniref:Cytochrome c3 family protein n=1 Tax=Hwangdonia lutea TaxID=3075823 RepID=A0AA97EQ21_9FLAO|nr:c-type cytochrome [Hwangdonia sp. SCSIO 19198]WOD45322.1 cytochrome c3 family protein [Hwangdonia sp. SCSIO 19198]
MIQVIYRKLTTNSLRLGFVVLLAFTTALTAQEGDPAKGKSLFNSNCAACHTLDKKMTGPALRHIEQRLADDEGLDREWLYTWIKNSAGMVKSGDAYANKIYDEYNGAAMTAFPQLSNEDIDHILAYTAEEKKAPVVAETAAAEGGAGGETGGVSNEIILGALTILFMLLAAGLFVVNKTLRRFAAAQNIDFEEDSKRKPLWKAFVQNQFLMLVVSIFFLLASAYFVFGYLMQIGVDQGYEPVQPIHYSHKIHAGDNGIDCKYCHSSARTSKHSGIPSLNVCMNCHKSIYEVAPETQAEGKKIGVDYNAEIKKLYAAVGWDDEEQQYTGETQPVKWVRIHNLPDFVYFNHSQHVTVAGIECQTCHGPVEEMEVMYQHAPLTMGWCVDCHRTSNVNVKDNAYYTKIHEELSKKYGVDKLTPAQMGALECGKCHY